MPADVVLLVVSKVDTPAAEVARRLGVDCVVLDEKALGPDASDAQMKTLLARFGVDLVVLAGYLRKVGPQTLRAFAGRILNTHPAPLPRPNQAATLATLSAAMKNAQAMRCGARV